MGWQSRCPPRPWPPLWRSHPCPAVTVHLGAGANRESATPWTWGRVRQNCHAGGCVKRQVRDPPSGLDLILGELDGLKFGPIHHDALAEQPSAVHRQMASVGGGHMPRCHARAQNHVRATHPQGPSDRRPIRGSRRQPRQRRPQQASFQPPHPEGISQGTQRDQRTLRPRGEHQPFKRSGGRTVHRRDGQFQPANRRGSAPGRRLTHMQRVESELPADPRVFPHHPLHLVQGDLHALAVQQALGEVKCTLAGSSSASTQTRSFQCFTTEVATEINTDTAAMTTGESTKSKGDRNNNTVLYRDGTCCQSPATTSQATPERSTSPQWRTQF